MRGTRCWAPHLRGHRDARRRGGVGEPEPPTLHEGMDALAADVCIMGDTGMWDIETPAITTMLRGMVYVEVTLHGPSSDLHSGLYGGAVVNPINELARLVSMIHDADGRVRFDGFYDDVREIDPEVKTQWDALGFDEAGFLGMIGLEQGHGESGRSTLERTWSRPTCDANGFIGGYTGEGAKTVIASHAKVKLSCRLVAGQDPERVLASIESFFRQNANPECRIEIESHGCNPPSRYRPIPTGREPPRRPRGRLLPGGEADRNRREHPRGRLDQVLLGIDSLLIGTVSATTTSTQQKFELTCLRNGIDPMRISRHSRGSSTATHRPCSSTQPSVVDVHG